MKKIHLDLHTILTLMGITAMLLLVPFTAMQITEQVQWSPADFIAAGTMLFGAGLAFLYLKNARPNRSYRIGAAVMAASVLFLVWSNLAVGIIGSENNSINLLYFGIAGVALAGSALSKLQPGGMALTLIAMAFSQLLITGYALISGSQSLPGSSLLEILAVNGFFIALFLVSGLMFKRAEYDMDIIHS